MLGVILLVILVLFLLGGLPQWGNYPNSGHFYGAGPWGGAVGLILVIVLILVLLGRI